MKQILLAATLLATFSLTADAQRMTLHEEFTGENCGPCAEVNPGFWALCDSGSNPDKLIHISYMVPIPAPGFYCNRTSAIHTVRSAYYSVPFAPYGRYDGMVPNTDCHGGDDAGQPVCFTQADIDAEAARPDSFTITASSVWNSSYTGVITTVTITCTAAWSASGATPNVRLRAALVQTNDFATPPGSNGETHFENVVQAMYPDANGTVISGIWNTGETHTYTVTGSVPAWVDKSKSPYMVVWMQDDNNQSILQAAKALPLTLTLDAGLVSSHSGACVAGSGGPVSPLVSLANTATTTLTSATIYYRIDGGTLMSQAWTGALAAGASINVLLTAPTVATGIHSLYDSVASPNGMADVNVVNNASTSTLLVVSSTPAPLPLTTNFESALPANWLFFDANANAQNWTIVTAGNHAAGSKAASFQSYSYGQGERDYIIMPVATLPADASLNFWVAYAPYNSVSNDRLEVVYSTDCGTTWSALYNKAGSVLSTTASTFDPFVPTATQWREETIPLSALPAGAILAFRATSDHGNNIYVDDINVRGTASVKTIAASAPGLVLYPNPAKEVINIQVSLEANSHVQILLTDLTGRVISKIADEQEAAGAATFTANTATIAPGVYHIVLRTEYGTATQQISIIK
jgi:hypothetical protein